MTFSKYQHVEKIDTAETDGLLTGICHVFYKIDGTNASVWYDIDKGLCTGSRNRELSSEKDNAGFHQSVMNDARYHEFFHRYPNLRLYGEWLVPHSLKTYREDAWRKFYVFDVMDGETYLTYDNYRPILDQAGIDYIPELATIKNPTPENLYDLVRKSGDFLVENGQGQGEGIVIKNYDYVNKFGRKVWGKIITNEFKERHHKEMGAPLINGTTLVEEKIIEDFLTTSFINKEKAKLELVNDGWSSKLIPQLLGVVFYEFIKEESWNFIKKFKNPTISYSLLNRLVVEKTKKTIGL